MTTTLFAAARVAGLSLTMLLFALGARAQAPDPIVLDGSTGVMPLAAALAKAFEAENPGLRVQVGKGLGTRQRLQALAQRQLDIALASHGLAAVELAAQQLRAHEVARTAVVFGVNAGVAAVHDLSAQQACDVYAGRVTNWKELGGPELEIAARTRPDAEVDAEVVRAGIGCMAEQRMPPSVKVMPKAGEMASELAGAAGAIGMTTMTVVEQSAGRIKALSLDGVEPSAHNVERKTYALVRPSFFVTHETPSPAVARFLAFVRSAAGEQLIRDNGAVPVR